VTPERDRLTRVPYELLSLAERTDIEAWLRALGVEPARTPIDALLEYDPVHREWCIEQYWRDGTGCRRQATAGEPRRVVLRRRGSPVPPSWPTTGINPPARLWIGDVGLSDYVTAIDFGPDLDGVLR
jgi:hypothetical protein